VLKTKDHIVIVNNAPGVVREVLVAPGSRVEPSMPLVRLENPEINHQIAEAQASLVEGESMYRKAMQEGQADMQPITKRIEATQKRLERLLEDRRSLVVTSPIGGVWVAPEVEQYRSMFANRGTPLGQIIDDRHFLFSSVVAQQDVAQLFSSGSRRAVVRLSGQTDIDIAVKTYTSIPMEHTALPSSALGWAAGGEVAVDMSDETGTKTTEPFYEVQAQLDRTSGALLLYGRAGKIKFVLPWEPLFSQGWRKFRQLIQKRYQI
jgi:putative peptide zinc metalloprotease protein